MCVCVCVCVGVMCFSNNNVFNVYLQGMKKCKKQHGRDREREREERMQGDFVAGAGVAWRPQTGDWGPPSRSSLERLRLDVDYLCLNSH